MNTKYVDQSRNAKQIIERLIYNINKHNEAIWQVNWT